MSSDPCPTCGETAFIRYTCEICGEEGCACCDNPDRKCPSCGKWLCIKCSIGHCGADYCKDCFYDNNSNADGPSCPECGSGSVLGSDRFSSKSALWKCIDCLHEFWAPWPED